MTVGLLLHSLAHQPLHLTEEDLVSLVQRFHAASDFRDPPVGSTNQITERA